MNHAQCVRKARNRQFLLAFVASLILLASTAAYAQITPLGDAYTNSADPITNYGANALLYVDGATETTYIQFDLASIPSGASVSQATLKLYVNAVTTAGSFNVDYVTSSWSESTIDHSNAPPLGSTIASDVAITTADKNQYILINVTSAVQAWLKGSETNDGIALVANSSFNANFDSKENTTTSHAPELDIVFASGSDGGTITGVTTSSGSGLTGGGTSGTLDLSLTNACAKSQVLEWNGSAWACANATGTGTITGVTTTSGSGLTGGGTSGTLNLSLTDACAPNQVLEWNGSAWACASVGTGTITGVTAGTDLTGGGTSGNVTLNLNTSALNSTYAQLNGGNTFTGNQEVNNGVLSVLLLGPSNAISGDSTNGVGVFGADSASGYGVEGLSSSAYGVFGNVDSSAAGSAGVYGLAGNIGVAGSSGTSGVGVAAYNTGTGDALFAENQTSGAYAAFFLGNVDVDGNLAKAGGSFKIDDPLDPANKYLYHSFVESPDMMNIYNGNVITDANGNASVQMPDWFEALNRDFRYQLTVIGQFAQAYVSQELANGEFSIKTDKANVKVSWQVTGIRQDAWANAHRIPVEVEKAADERGFYMHPELFGAPAEQGIAAHRHPGMLNPPKGPSRKTEAHTAEQMAATK